MISVNDRKMHHDINCSIRSCCAQDLIIIVMSNVPVKTVLMSAPEAINN